jgi:hypothetical protein
MTHRVTEPNLLFFKTLQIYFWLEGTKKLRSTQSNGPILRTVTGTTKRQKENRLCKNKIEKTKQKRDRSRRLIWYSWHSWLKAKPPPRELSPFVQRPDMYDMTVGPIAREDTRKKQCQSTGLGGRSRDAWGWVEKIHVRPHSLRGSLDRQRKNDGNHKQIYFVSQFQTNPSRGVCLGDFFYDAEGETTKS